MPARSKMEELSLRLGGRYHQPAHGALGARENAALHPHADASLSGVQRTGAGWA